MTREVSAGLLEDDAAALWRALLLASGDAALAESAASAAMKEGAQDASMSTVELWRRGFAELSRLQDGAGVMILSLGLSGTGARELGTVSSYLTTASERDRRLLLGCHLGEFSASELSVLLDEELDEERLAEWNTYYAGILSSAGLAGADEWSELVSGIEAPFESKNMFESTTRTRRLQAALVVAACSGALILLLAASFFSNAGRSVTGEDDLRVATPTTVREVADPQLPACSARMLSNAVSVSPVAQRRLSPRPLSDALSQADLVVRADVSSVRTESDEVVFEISSPHIVFGEATSPPTSVRLAARLGAQDPPGLTQVIAFVRQETDGWTVTEGGMWAECEEGRNVPIGAEWPGGSDWPDNPGPKSLSVAIATVLEDNTVVEVKSHGDRRSGGLQLLDGRSVVLEVPEILAPLDAATAVIGSGNVVATFVTSNSEIVLHRIPCAGAPGQMESEGVGATVCSSDGSLRIELTTSRSLTADELSQVDAHVIADGAAEHRGVWLIGGSEGAVVAIDAAELAVRWRIETAEADPAFVSTADHIAVVGSRNVMLVDASSGSIRWKREVTRGTSAMPVRDGWLLTLPRASGPAVALVESDAGDVVWVDPASSALVAADDSRAVTQDLTDGVRTISVLEAATGVEVWRTAPHEVPNPGDSPTVVVDFEREFVVTVASGQVELFELADGQRRWITSVPSAQTIQGLWANTLTVVTDSGRTVKLGFVDGFILPP